MEGLYALQIQNMEQEKRQEMKRVTLLECQCAIQNLVLSRLETMKF